MAISSSSAVKDIMAFFDTRSVFIAGKEARPMGVKGSNDTHTHTHAVPMDAPEIGKGAQRGKFGFRPLMTSVQTPQRSSARERRRTACSLDLRRTWGGTADRPKSWRCTPLFQSTHRCFCEGCKGSYLSDRFHYCCSLR